MKKIFLIVVSFLSIITPYSQNYNMPGVTINTCSGNFKDSGGNGNYGNNENITTTFCSNSGNCIQVNFTAFSVENFFDVLSIYDGPSIASPLIGTYTGVTSPGLITSTTGCLTFRFTSDGSVVSTGWLANISCVACPPPPPPFCYTGVVIPFSPDPPGGTSLVLGDDQYSPVVNIGFNFCLDGVTYTQLLIASNNYVDFDLGLAGGFAPWQITSPIPTTTPVEVERTIMCPWEDLLPPSGGTITYQTLGIAPFRRFVVSWTSIPMFSCTGQLYTSQLKLLETTNCIEMHLTNKPVCAGWNGGQAIQGINNSNGTQAYVYPGRNAPTQWSVVNDAVRLYPTCVPCSTQLCTPPLPIELATFEGFCDDNRINLNWVTLSEINNQKFRIEKSLDMINWELVDEVVGFGNSNQTLDYQLVDKNPFSGISYYRLIQIDYNGDSKIYDPISVECYPENNYINLYPNPTYEVSTLVFFYNGNNTQEKIEILDITGRVVKSLIVPSNKGLNQVTIDLSTESSGIYFIHTNFNPTILKVIKK